MACHSLAVDIYEIQVNLRPGVSDIEFSEALAVYLGGLQDAGRIEHWRLVRRKLGFGVGPEFKVWIETMDLAQLDEAFHAAAARRTPVEDWHFGVNSLVTDFEAALYRDFPDSDRFVGEERF